MILSPWVCYLSQLVVVFDSMVRNINYNNNSIFCVPDEAKCHCHCASCYILVIQIFMVCTSQKLQLASLIFKADSDRPLIFFFIFRRKNFSKRKYSIQLSAFFPFPEIAHDAQSLSLQSR